MSSDLVNANQNFVLFMQSLASRFKATTGPERLMRIMTIRLDGNIINVIVDMKDGECTQYYS